MAAISLFWDINMAAVTSCENTLTTLGTLKSGHLIEVGRLMEVQYKLDRSGSKHDFIGSI